MIFKITEDRSFVGVIVENLTIGMFVKPNSNRRSLTYEELFNEETEFLNKVTERGTLGEEINSMIRKDYKALPIKKPVVLSKTLKGYGTKLPEKGLKGVSQVLGNYTYLVGGIVMPLEEFTYKKINKLGLKTEVNRQGFLQFGIEHGSIYETAIIGKSISPELALGLRLYEKGIEAIIIEDKAYINRLDGSALLWD